MLKKKNLFDFIIVGAGSAGATLANRLSANKDLRVALIEAGPPDTSFLTSIPFAFALLLPQYLGKKYIWGNFESEKEARLNNRTIYQPRGKTYGGSSSINAMLYIRGNKFDYDNWQKLGNNDWEFSKCLPYFKRCENNLSI